MLLKIFGGELSQTFIEVLGTQWIFTSMEKRYETQLQKTSL